MYIRIYVCMYVRMYVYMYEFMYKSYAQWHSNHRFRRLHHYKGSGNAFNVKNQRPISCVSIINVKLSV